MHKIISFLSILLLILVAIFMTACGDSGVSDVGGMAGVKEGKDVFESGGAVGIPCNTCHTIDGSELIGPTLQGIGERAEFQVSGMGAEEYLRESITDPGAHIVDGFDNTMPPMYGDRLSEEEVDNLVAYLLSLD